MGISTLVQSVYLYPIDAGGPPIQDPPGILPRVNAGLNWKRVYLAGGLAVDINPANQVLTNRGWLYGNELLSNFESTYLIAQQPSYLIQLLNLPFTLTNVKRKLKVLRVENTLPGEQVLSVGGLVNRVAPADACLCAFVNCSASHYDSDSFEGLSPIGISSQQSIITNPVTIITDPLVLNGQALSSGTKWFVTNGLPPPSFGNEGDLALDSFNSNVYQKEGGVWVIKTNLQGQSSNQFLIVNSPPQASLGINGDVAVDKFTGIFYKKELGIWQVQFDVTLSTEAGGGGGGPGVSDKYFIYTQAAPLQEWAFGHGLNKFPSVTVVDQDRKLVINYDVTYTDENNIVISFAFPFAGQAYLN